MSLYRKRAASPSARLPTRKQECRPSQVVQLLHAPIKQDAPARCAVYGYILHTDNARLPENLFMPFDKKGMPLSDFVAEARRRVAPASKTSDVFKLNRHWAIVCFVPQVKDDAHCAAADAANKSVADFITKDIHINGTAVLYNRFSGSGNTDRVDVLNVLAEPHQYIDLLEEEAVDAARTKIREQIEKQLGDAARQSSSSE